MKTLSSLAALAAASSLPLLLAQDLVPVAPGTPAAPGTGVPHESVLAPGPGLDLEAWRARLSDPDFPARAGALDEAAALAAHDAGMRAALEAWATGRDELAWTAWLALRQADHADAAPSRGLRTAPHGGAWMPFVHPPGTTFGPDGPTWPGQQSGTPSPFGTWDPFGGGGLDVWFGGPFGAPGLPDGAERGGLSISVGPDGVEVRVEEATDEGTETRTYGADSMEELEAAHPELFAEGGALEGFSADGPGLPGPGGPAVGDDDPFHGGLFGRAPLPGPGSLPGGLRPALPVPPAPAPEVGGPVLRDDVLGVMVAGTPGDGAEAPAGGLLVDSVVGGTIAAHVGVGPGDLVIEVAGARVRSAEDVAAALADREDGAPVKVRWVDPDGTLETGTWTPSEE